MYDNFVVSEYDEIKLNEYISEILIKKKFIGKIILRELIKKIFDPKRLLYICKQYNLNLEHLLNIYQ